MNKPVCDLCDEFEASIQVVEPVFRGFGGRKAFSGRIATVKCHEDNSWVRDAVARPGAGEVLVVDGGGSVRRALLGDQMAAQAAASRWEGILIFGAVRDVAALEELDLGVIALAAVPLKTAKKGFGEAGVALRFAGATFRPGEFLYADRDGIIVSPRALT